jgi:hypothetical protein
MKSQKLPLQTLVIDILMNFKAYIPFMLKQYSYHISILSLNHLMNFLCILKYFPLTFRFIPNPPSPQTSSRSTQTCITKYELNFPMKIV